jgi:hypothetical protein
VFRSLSGRRIGNVGDQRLEIEAPNLVLLRVLRAGVHIMAFNEKCRLTIGFERTGVTGSSGMIFIDDIRLYAPLNNEVELVFHHCDGPLFSVLRCSF